MKPSIEVSSESPRRRSQVKRPAKANAAKSKSSISSAELKRFMTELGLGAGAVLTKYFMKVKKIERKEGAGIVTEADKFAEDVVLKKIFRKYPQSSIITEESGEFPKESSLCWIIDPLDGTSNYAHGFPWFCVSIGLHEDGVPRAGLIYQPITKELFYAERGRGATLNGRAIRVSKTKELEDSLLGTGFYYSTGEKLRSELEIFGRIQEQALGVRRPGSAALDLAFTASGRYDGFWERGLSSWDVAAGSVLVTEAGGRVSNYSGGHASVHDAEIVATNGMLHGKILDLIEG